MCTGDRIPYVMCDQTFIPYKKYTGHKINSMNSTRIQNGKPQLAGYWVTT